ncbi:tyrosine-type recombinase/integrase [Flintibacter muris]|uniref:tyrosine-type recombinase/integrase n=1 Tax=Flintibacter muris TaxID=2941327 RepID=UPI00203FF3C5|nr:tyrosine-type recombinase/integrase [Flintibacter muris]
MTIEQIAAAVPAYLGFYDDKSPNTKELKCYALSFFIDFMSKEYPGQELTPEMVLEYRRSMFGLEPNTITQYMRQIRSAISFMLQARMVTGENPVPTLFVGQEKYQPYDNLLTHDDIQRILRPDYIPEVISGRVYLRARAMTILTLASGLRLAELLTLTPEDLDWESGKAVVRHGKGDKRRLVPFPAIAQEAVKQYMDHQRKACPEGMPLFVNALKKGGYKLLNKRTAQYNITAYVEAMTGRKDISPHALRHSAASWWVSCGVSMREVQTLLGHSKIETTERYASLVAPDTAPIRSANAVMAVAFGKPD